MKKLFNFLVIISMLAGSVMMLSACKTDPPIEEPPMVEFPTEPPIVPPVEPPIDPPIDPPIEPPIVEPSMEDSYFIYENSEDGVFVKGLTNKGEKSKSLQIPEVFNGKKIVGLKEYAFFKCINIESIYLPSSIEIIPYGAFDGCKNLTSVVLPTNLKIINEFAFSSCEKLSSISFPDSLQTIKHGAFDNCSELKTINISEQSALTMIEGSTFDTTKWYASFPDGYVYLNKVLYKYKGKLPKGSVVNVEEGTVAIAENAFYEQSGMVEINFPESLTTIGNGAFTRTEISNIHLTKNIKNFSAGCLSQDYISKITVEDENQSFCIRDEVLYNKECDTLVLFPSEDLRTEFIVPEGVKKIGDSAFKDNRNLKNVIFPETIEVLGDYSFLSTKFINFLNFPQSLKEIGQQAFDYSAISYVRLNGNVPIGNFTNQEVVFFVERDKVEQYKSAWNTDSKKCKIFSNDLLVGDFLIENNVLIRYFGSDRDVIVPGNVKVIGEYAFYYNNEIINVVLPEGVEEIGQYAFSSSGLNNITLPESLKIIGTGAFHFCQGLSGDFYIPANVEEIKTNAFITCFHIENFVVDKNNSKYYSIDGVLFDRDLKMLVAYPNRNAYSIIGGAQVEDIYIVPDGIEIIAEDAFSYTFIKNIILPDSLKIIRDSAFFSCKVESLIIPEGVTEIGYSAFTYSYNLKSIVIPTTVTEWGYLPFRDFKADQTIYFRGSKSSIPNDVLECDAQFVFDYVD